MAPTCYAQRLLNPFRGVMNIIEHQGAEAVTTDGLHWDIYVRDTALVEDLADGHKVQTSDIRYGSWSEKQGLKRGAIYPSNDFKLLEHRGAIVYEYLLEHFRDVPFGFLDQHELWLLDERGLPLALLNSVTREQDIEVDCHIDWRAGRECCRHFRSASSDVLDSDDAHWLSAGERLTRQVNNRAGRSPAAQWFRRHADGTATGLNGINLPHGFESRRLSDDRFPDYFVSDNPRDAQHQRLLEDFFAWQAPCLLLLPTLDRQTRARLETQAIKRAVAVAQHCHLYPAIVDAEAIRAARVEALLRATAPTVHDDDETMATYYIELNVTRTN
jgi:hypothetical protein